MASTAASLARRVARAGLVQMTSVNDASANFSTCSTLVAEAVSKGCEMVFFPECFSFIGARPGEAQKAAEPLSGPIMQRYLALAKQHSVWLSLGGFQEASGSSDEERIYNTHVVVDAAGTIRAAYRKIHLYDVPMVGLVESKQALAGSELVSCESPAGMLGITICCAPPPPPPPCRPVPPGPPCSKVSSVPPAHAHPTLPVICLLAQTTCASRSFTRSSPSCTARRCC